MGNYAIKNGLRYFCHTSENFDSFIIEDITKQSCSYAQFFTNSKLYHATIKDCLEHLSGTMQPIIFNGQDINPIRECEDIFLHYNPYTGECYRPIDWEKYYSIINTMDY